MIALTLAAVAALKGSATPSFAESPDLVCREAIKRAVRDTQEYKENLEFERNITTHAYPGQSIEVTQKPEFTKLYNEDLLILVEMLDESDHDEATPKPTIEREVLKLLPKAKRKTLTAFERGALVNDVAILLRALEQDGDFCENDARNHLIPTASGYGYWKKQIKEFIKKTD